MKRLFQVVSSNGVEYFDKKALAKIARDQSGGTLHRGPDHRLGPTCPADRTEKD